MGACYGWDELEAGAGSGGAGFFAAGVASSDLGKGSLPRAPSVDDLFAPLWRLEVQQQIPEAAMASVSNSKRGELKSGAPELLHGAASGTDKNLAPVARITLPASPEKKIIAPGASTSTSDEDLNADEKKQKRMLSNRESARRSRLRKQQHLEELRSQLLELRAQNSHILGKLSVASQQFSQLSHDNQLLRLQASEFGRQLQRLHREASAHHPDGLHAFGFGTSHLDPPGVAIRSPPSPPCSSSSAYTIVTDVLQGSSLCS